MCVPAYAVRAAFVAVFPEHLESLVPRSTRKNVCACGGENKVREAYCVPAAQNRRSSAGLDAMPSEECNFQGSTAFLTSAVRTWKQSYQTREEPG